MIYMKAQFSAAKKEKSMDTTTKVKTEFGDRSKADFVIAIARFIGYSLCLPAGLLMGAAIYDHLPAKVAAAFFFPDKSLYAVASLAICCSGNIWMFRNSDSQALWDIPCVWSTAVCAVAAVAYFA